MVFSAFIPNFVFKPIYYFMNTKIFKRIVLMMSIMLISLSAFADSESSQKSNPPANGSAVLLLVRKDPDIKRMPSNNHLDVVYENGILSLLSESYEGDFSLSFINIESGESYEVSSIFVGETISVDLPCGEYEVSAMRSDGLILAGFMQVFEYK